MSIGTKKREQDAIQSRPKVEDERRGLRKKRWMTKEGKKNKETWASDKLLAGDHSGLGLGRACHFRIKTHGRPLLPPSFVLCSQSSDDW